MASSQPDFSVSSPLSPHPSSARGVFWGYLPHQEKPILELGDLSGNPVTHLARDLLFDILCYDGSQEDALLLLGSAFEFTPGITLVMYASLTLVSLYPID